VKASFVDTLRCLGCRAERLVLEAAEQDEHEVRRGALRCAACGRRYEITHGIPDFLPKEDEVIAREIEGWRQLAGPLDDTLIPTMAALPYYPHDPWLHMAPDFVQAFELVSFVGQRVLDLGAGRSWSSRHIIKVGQAREVVAIDILRQKYIGLETADLFMELDRIHFERVLGSMHDMPFRDREFDIVFSAATVHHSSDLAALFAEIGRVLRPGGVFLMIAEPSKHPAIPGNRPDNAETRHGINEHVYALAEYLAALRRGGFRSRIVAPRSIFYRLTYTDEAFTQSIPRPLRRLPAVLRRRLVRALMTFPPTRRAVYRRWSLPLTLVARKLR
jgi:ubiquinone/menaquinone biosynthesis C-methylase UbiE/uncharacterized protein YbaR (Trm112 family)